MVNMFLTRVQVSGVKLVEESDDLGLRPSIAND